MDTDCLPGPDRSNRGNSEQIKKADSPVSKTIVDYSGPLETVTVLLSTKLQAQEQDNANARPAATVEWGCGGATSSVQVDLANGTALRLVADWVRVIGTLLEPIDAATWDEFKATAMVLPGNHAGLPPTWTSIAQVINQTADAFVSVPAFARECFLHWPSDSTPFDSSFTLAALAGDGDATVLGQREGDTMANGEPFLLPNGTRRIRARAMGGTMRGFLLQFSLGL